MKEISRKFIKMDTLKGRDTKEKKRERRWCEKKELNELRNYRRMWSILEMCCSKTGSKRISTKVISNQQISDKNKKRKRKILSRKSKKKKRKILRRNGR